MKIKIFFKIFGSSQYPFFCLIVDLAIACITIPIFLLNVTVEFALFMASGNLFQRRVPFDTIELTSNVFAIDLLFSIHISCAFFQRVSALMTEFLLNGTERFSASTFANSLWTFHSSVLSSSTSYGMPKSLCKILNDLLWT